MGKQAAVAVAAGVVVGPGPLHAGIVGRVDRVGAAPLACCWYPKQLPIRDREHQQDSLKTEYRFNKELGLEVYLF